MAWMVTDAHRGVANGRIAGDQGPRSMTTVGSRVHTYTVCEDWAKWPADLPAAEVVGIANDSTGRVYAGRARLVDGVARPINPPVVVFDEHGNCVDSWGNGVLLFPHALHIANDTVHLVDRQRSAIIMFTLDGKLLQIVGRPGVHSDTGIQSYGRLPKDAPRPRAAGPFNYPAKMVSSPWGDLYVADGHRNARVHRFDNDGHLIQSWGIWGETAPGEFNRPHSVLVGSDNRIYVCDRDNGRIQIFSKYGEFIAVWSEGSWAPSDIAQSPDGAFVVSEALEEGAHEVRHRISVLDGEGKLLARWDTRDSHALCVDRRGNIYVGLAIGMNIDKYSVMR